MDVTYRDDGTTIFADVTGAPVGEELFAELRTAAVVPNTSTEGVTAGVHKTVNANGEVTFHAPKDFLFPDFPRSIVLVGPMSQPQVFAS